MATNSPAGRLELAALGAGMAIARRRLRPMLIQTHGVVADGRLDARQVDSARDELLADGLRRGSALPPHTRSTACTRRDQRPARDRIGIRRRIV